MKRVDDSKKEKPPKTIEEVGAMLQGIAYDIGYLRETCDLILSASKSGGEFVKQARVGAPIQVPPEYANVLRWDGRWKFDLLERLEPYEFGALCEDMRSLGYIYSKKHNAFWKPKGGERK